MPGPTPSLAPDTARMSYHSSHSGSSVDDNTSIEPSFLQNPLADNDYTFTKMKGRFCKPCRHNTATAH